MNFYDSVAPIIEEAGIELRKDFGKVEAMAFKSASHGSAVTELDQKTERFIAERLHKLFPDIEFFGEEFGGNDKAERFWLVDPIDGTSNFIRGIPFSTTMIALIEGGQPIFSIIYNFMSKEMFSAKKGEGARLNGERVHVSKRPPNHAAVFFETNKRKKENLEKYLHVNEQFSILSTMNAGFEFCLVASGKIEARVCLDPHGKDWDYAPGALLVAEAGGIVRNLGSDDYDFRNHDFIAGSPAVYEALNKLF
jgi:myo-inositol-1(or 4)-monophosphatase